MSTDATNSRLGKLSIAPGKPLELADIDEGPLLQADDETNIYRERVAKTLKSYLAAIQALLDGKYRELRDIVPLHMTCSCRPAAFVFSEGIVIRYDRHENHDLAVLVAVPVTLSSEDGASHDPSLATATQALSENFLHCVTDPSNFDPGPNTPTITLSAEAQESGETRHFCTQRIWAAVSPPKTPDTTSSILRPLPALSIRNEFDITMHVEIESDPAKPRRKFLVRSSFRIPAGWEALEIFPRYPVEVWNPDTASLWAENDLLAAVLQRNLRDSQFRAMDPMYEARKQMARLLSECENLLSGNEEPLHQYIKSNPGILCPTHYRVWSKLPLGKRITDFVFQEPSGEYLLVELESPLRLLFRADGQPREELIHALDQVVDWRRYIEDNLKTVQNELGLRGISVNPSCLVVIGRSASLDDNAKRKLVALQNSMPKIRIMTYDDLILNARASAENILGPLWDAGPNAEVYLLP